VGREVLLVAHPFEGDFRVQLVGQPGDLDGSFLGQALDSDRVDVAPRSNVVGVDEQGYRHGC